MAKIKVHAGDFLKGDGTYTMGAFSLRTDERAFLGEVIHERELDQLDLATEENVKKLGGTVGWGMVGGVLLGPIGLLAGLLAGGRKKEVTFVARFKDGRKLLATTDAKTFTKLQAALFK